MGVQVSIKKIAVFSYKIYYLIYFVSMIDDKNIKSALILTSWLKNWTRNKEDMAIFVIHNFFFLVHVYEREDSHLALLSGL